MSQLEASIKPQKLATVSSSEAGTIYGGLTNLLAAQKGKATMRYLGRSLVSAIGILLMETALALAGNPSPEYLYVPIPVPNDRDVYPVGINNRGDVILFDYYNYPHQTGYLFHDGQLITLGIDVIPTVVNERGDVICNKQTPFPWSSQAMLYRNGNVTPLTFLKGEFASRGISINNEGVILGISYDKKFNGKFVVSHNGKTVPIGLETALGVPADYIGFGNFNSFIGGPGNKFFSEDGTIVGSVYLSAVGGFRGFRFDSRNGDLTLLEPINGDTHAFAVGMNNAGDAVGYSFEFNSVERIGIWDQDANFNVYFTEGTAEHPNISNVLLFNASSSIVISEVLAFESDYATSYLVPKPGVRLDMTPFVVNPPYPPLSFLFDIGILVAMNDGGMIVGSGFDVNTFYSQPYLLVPID